MEVFNSVGVLPGGDCLDLCWVHLDAIGSDDQAEVPGLHGLEFTLINVDLQAGIHQAFDNLSYMGAVFLPCLRVDKYIIQIRRANLVKEVVQRVVDIVLE